MRFDPIAGQFRTYEGGGKGQPAAPDYAGAAATQATSSKETTAQQNFANRPNIYTPWGQQTWDTSSTTDPTTGVTVPVWSSNIKLTPEEQASLTGQQKLGAARTNTAQGLMGQVADATKNPFDWASMPAAPGNISDEQNKTFKQMQAEVEPGRMRQQESLNTRLANQGLPINSAAYNNANTALQGNFAQADKGLLAQSSQQGISNVAAQSQLRQQAIAEEAQRRGIPLNEMNALISGQQVSMPQGFAGAPNTTASRSEPNRALDAAIAQGNYQSQNQNDWGSALGGIAGVAGAGMKMYNSDRRLKSNIVRIGEHPVGVGIYEYDIFDRHEIGVIAQELLAVRPDLVAMDSNGYLMVNYGGLI